MTEPEGTWQARLRYEFAELKDRMDKLQKFIQTPEFDALPSVDRGDMLNQYTAMGTYYTMLRRRIARLPDA